MKSRLTSAAYTLTVTAALLAFLLYPARCLAAVSDGVSLWAASVLPAALPFLFLTGMFAGTPLFARLGRRLSPLFSALGVPGAGGGCFLLSVLSGYPAGAKSAADLCGHFPRRARFYTACLASTSGPAFLVGVLGTAMARSPALGWIMLLSHVLGVLLPVLLLARLRPAEGRAAIVPPAASLPETLSASVLAVLTVGGAVALFYAFGQMLLDVLAPLSLPAPVAALLTGLLEMTSGCAALLKKPSALSTALCVFLVTFGGLCVLVQQWTFLAKLGISCPKFLAVKFVQALTAALLCYLISTWGAPWGAS